MGNTFYLYVHIPFCQSKCPYCDFVSFRAPHEQIDRYINSLQQEIQLIFSKDFKGYDLQSIYFGGGTPSWIPERYIAEILKTIQHFFPLDGIEKTIELNPNVEHYKIQSYRDMGINRLSIGAQSFKKDKLTFLERDHGVNDTMSLLREIERVNFPNTSVDIIFGLSDEENIEEEIANLGKYHNVVKHVSAYELTLEKSVPLFERYQKKYLCKEERGGELYADMIRELGKLGYEQYEISNFAQKGYESKHNLSYWSWKNYLGVGISAASFMNFPRPYGSRWKNVNSINEYFQAIEENRLPRIYETIDRRKAFEDYLLTGLRKNSGISLVHFENTFGEHYKACLQSHDILVKEQLLEVNNDFLYVTNAGRMVLDSIIEMLTKDF